MPMALREWYLRAAKRFGWPKMELIANIATAAHEKIVPGIDDKKCCKEEKMENSESTIDVFVWRAVQKIYQCTQYGNRWSKGYR